MTNIPPDIPELPMPDGTSPRHMGYSNRMVRSAVAATFIANALVRTDNDKYIRSAGLMMVCKDWCRSNGLAPPSIHILSAALRDFGAVYAKSNGQRIWRGVQFTQMQDRLPVMLNVEELHKLTRRPPIMTLPEFIRLTGISRSTFYAQCKRGTAPTHRRIGGRVMIATTDALDWCHKHAFHAAALNITDWALDLGGRSDQIWRQTCRIL
ncbi:MAG: helix-turn-helix domain-containing protein [Magnetospirillum sp. WYHS-4]